MSFFQTASSNPNSLQSSFLGQPYNYSDQIRSPDQIGMSDKGDLETLGNDITGMLSYVNILVDGGGKASIPSGPLGNKYFMKTGATCKDVATKQETDRYIYVNNVPSGAMPGLIKGTVSGLGVLNPFALMGSFMAGSDPPCMEITMQTIDSNNNQGQETHFVTLADINNMSSSSFPNGQKPKMPNVENFTTLKNSANYENYDDANSSGVNMPDDIIIQAYFVCLGLIGIYLLYRLGQK